MITKTRHVIIRDRHEYLMDRLLATVYNAFSHEKQGEGCKAYHETQDLISKGAYYVTVYLLSNPKITKHRLSTSSVYSPRDRLALK